MWSFLASPSYNGIPRTAQPGLNAPGGGARTKVENIAEAGIPVVNRIPLCETFGLLVEPLSMNHNPNSDSTSKSFELNIEELKESRSFKVCWAEEQQLLRWQGKKREALLSAVSAIFVCNKYLQQLLRVYVRQPIKILRTPINTNRFAPDCKPKRVVAIGKVCIEKNIAGVMDLFSDLPSSWEKIFIGNAGLWGQEAKPVDKALEGQLKNVCDWYPSLTQNEVAEIASNTFAYVNLARYDVGSLAFLEFASAGCHCFCWDFHPMFDEYQFVHRFDTPAEGAEKIIDTMAKERHNACTRARIAMESMHSYKAFRKQLKALTMEIYQC